MVVVSVRAARRGPLGRRVGVVAAVLLTFLASACSAGSGGGTAAGGQHYTAVSHPPSPSPTGAPVHISLLEGDGGVYGVGMPIIAYFDRKITDSSAFTKAVTVTVNGKPANGAWYFENSSRSGQALEAHYRPQSYWPAHAKIYMNMPVDGLSAGPGLLFDDSLTLSMSTGAANVSSVDCSTERMTVTSDGKTVRTMPVSCGEASHPTYTGTKVLIQKGEANPKTGKMRPDGAVEMTSNEPGDTYDLIVPWSVRVTYSGEYVHSAAWNSGNIGHRSTSHGCTNLNVDDAKWYYNFSTVGDVVTYANTGGSQMPSWDGYGDWNVDWSTWQAGGAVPAA